MRKNLISYVVIAAWVVLISVASFFFPYVIDSIPAFRIKSLKIEGLQFTPSEIISTAISETTRNNVIFLYTHRRSLLEKLNELSGSAIREIQIHPRFYLSGSDIKVIVKERKPYLTAVIEDYFVFFDEDGFKFYNEYYHVPYPVVYAGNIHLVENYFDTIKKLIDAVNASGHKVASVYLTDINTILYTDKEVKITMLPIFLVNDSLISRVSKIISGMQEIQSIEFISEDVVIVR